MTQVQILEAIAVAFCVPAVFVIAVTWIVLFRLRKKLRTERFHQIKRDRALRQSEQTLTGTLRKGVFYVEGATVYPETVELKMAGSAK